MTFILPIAIIFSIWLIYFFCMQLSRKHGSDIRVVWYLFSLSLVMTLGIALWAINIGAIDEHGNFFGSVGASIKWLLKFMLDLNMDVKIFLTIVVLITLPQFVSYILSGLFGSASPPLLIEGSLSFFVWSLVKSFAVASGILFLMAILGLWNHWTDWSWLGACTMMLMSTMLITLSFVALNFYRDIEGVFAALQNKAPEGLRKILVAIHAWFTRNEPFTLTAETIELIKSRKVDQENLKELLESLVKGIDQHQSNCWAIDQIKATVAAVESRHLDEEQVSRFIKDLDEVTAILGLKVNYGKPTNRKGTLGD